MTILTASFWTFKGKYVVILEDDLKETEAEGQTDIMYNRLDAWLEKKVNFHALLDAKVAACAGQKNNKLATKVATWLVEKKIPSTTMEAMPSGASSLAESLRLLLVDIDEDTFSRWAQGTSNVRGMSTATWATVYGEAKDFIEKRKNEKKGTIVSKILSELDAILTRTVAEYPQLGSATDKKNSERPLNLLKKLTKVEARHAFAKPLFLIDQLMQNVVAVEALQSTLKRNDRVFFFAGIGNAMSPMLLEMLEEQFQMQQVYGFPADDAAHEDISEKELAAVMDGFLPAKKSNKKKKGKGKKKGEGKGESKGESKDDEDGEDDEDEPPAAGAGAGAGAAAPKKEEPKAAAKEEPKEDAKAAAAAAVAAAKKAAAAADSKAETPKKQDQAPKSASKPAGEAKAASGKKSAKKESAKKA